MKSKIIIILILAILTSISDNISAQGFFMKPSISYGKGLNNENIRYYSNSINGEVATYNEKIDFSYTNVLENRKDKIEMFVPLGKGKIFGLDIGYENKKWLYYTMGLSSGLSDKYETYSFYDRHSLGIAYETRSHEVKKQVISSVWYGAQFGIGVYKNINKYKFLADITGFIGSCRIRVLNTSTTDVVNRNFNEQPQMKTIYKVSNHVLHGSYMSGYGMNFGIERSVSEKGAIGLSIGYKCQYYSPSKISDKDLTNVFNFFGSAIPISKSSNSATESLIAVPVYVFESLSLVATWKRYLLR